MNVEQLALLLQWFGCFTGLVGSFLLAMRGPRAGWGFVFYVVSNALWATFGFVTGAYGLLVMQFGFTVASGLGIYQWLVVPWQQRRRLSPRPDLMSAKTLSKRRTWSWRPLRPLSERAAVRARGT